MKSAALLLALVALAGCGGSGPGPTTSPAGGEHYLVDSTDPDTGADYDLLAADFRELNGSVVLDLEFRDVNKTVPRVLAVLSVEANETSRSYFVRSAADLDRPAPHVKWEMGRVEGESETVLGEICAFHRSTEAPYVRRLDLPHNWTDLTGGGQITRLHVEIRSFDPDDGDRVFDVGDASKTFYVRGGPNPHGTCPLLAERPN